MAHDSEGRIFIGNTGVEIADIKQVLGTSDNDIGLLCSDKTWDRTQTPWVLVDANLINKWAKYKPVRYDKRGILTGEDTVVHLPVRARRRIRQRICISASARKSHLRRVVPPARLRWLQPQRAKPGAEL